VPLTSVTGGTPRSVLGSHPPSSGSFTRPITAICKQVVNRPPRWDTILAESTESRPSRFAVAFASLDTVATAKGWQLRGGRGGAGYDAKIGAGQRNVAVQLACN
jgi:hypothetical protein